MSSTWQKAHLKKKKHRLRAHPQVSGYFWKRRFFLCFIAFCPHVNGVFGPPKRRFLKTPASRLRVDERKRSLRIRWCHHTTHALQEALSYLHRFISFVWMSKNDLNTPQVDAYFLEKGEENPPLLRSLVSRSLNDVIPAGTTIICWPQATFSTGLYHLRSGWHHKAFQRH